MLTIRMDYAQMRTEAKRLRQLAERLEICKGKVIREGDAMASAWQGQAYNQYTENNAMLATRIGKYADLLKMRAERLDNIANDYERREKALKTVINNY